MPRSQTLTVDIAARVPHLSEYFGLWLMHEEHFRAAVARITSTDLGAHVRVTSETRDADARDAQAAGDGPLSQRYATPAAGVAQIDVVGPMMKFESSFGGASTVRARRQLRAAVNDSAINKILLRFDTPGGTVAGTQEFAADIVAARAIKPVIGYAEDLCASAGFWGLSQCDQAYANQMALIGSIGTYSAVADYSKWAEQKGVKVHVLSTGKYKGAGVAGTEITEEQLAEWQRIVNEINAHFLAAVSAGRKLSAERVAELADGRVHLAGPAQALGLIDGVRSFDELLAELADEQPTTKTKGARAMSTETNTPTEPKAATVAEIKTACAGAPADFVLEQVEKGATLAQAMQAFIARQSADLEARNKELAEAKTTAKTQASKPGVPALNTEASSGGETGGDAEAEWHEAVAAKLKTHKTKAAAVAAVVRERPELREAYVQAHNARHRTATSR